MNKADGFMEGDPNLVTAYGLLALAYARPFLMAISGSAGDRCSHSGWTDPPGRLSHADPPAPDRDLGSRCPIRGTIDTFAGTGRAGSERRRRPGLGGEAPRAVPLRAGPPGGLLIADAAGGPDPPG